MSSLTSYVTLVSILNLNKIKYHKKKVTNKNEEPENTLKMHKNAIRTAKNSQPKLSKNKICTIVRVI